MLGEDVNKIFALQNSSFFVTQDCEVFFCGKYSYNSKIKFISRIMSRQFKAGLIQ